MSQTAAMKSNNTLNISRVGNLFNNNDDSQMLDKTHQEGRMSNMENTSNSMVNMLSHQQHSNTPGMQSQV